ncbi:uncharacterized protein TNCV_3019871 [Trichonephila clavipes]|nr:uncharacterized protein TNCV_3019871 [Trichonephila clavipes]
MSSREVGGRGRRGKPLTTSRAFSLKIGVEPSKTVLSYEFKRRFASYLSNEAKGKAWKYLASSKPVIPDSHRPVAVSLFRLLIWHDCLNAHLFKIRLKDISVSTLRDSG